MKKIPLTQGKYALVDDQDYDMLIKIKWCAERCSTVKENFYARNRALNIKMHRLILGLGKSHLVGDHINHNTLDNRRCNLRAVTKAENNRNRRKRK